MATPASGHMIGAQQVAAVDVKLSPGDDTAGAAAAGIIYERRREGRLQRDRATRHCLKAPLDRVVSYPMIDESNALPAPGNSMGFTDIYRQCTVRSSASRMM